MRDTRTHETHAGMHRGRGTGKQGCMQGCRDAGMKGCRDAGVQG